MRSRIRKYIWNRLALGWKLRSGVAIKVTRHGDWYIYNEIFVDAEYDAPILESFEVMKKATTQPIFLDLGANVGFFLLRWLDLWIKEGRPGMPPRFVVVEPSPECCIELRRRLAMQPGVGVEFKVLERLVGELSGDAVLVPGKEHFANRIGSRKDRGPKLQYLDLNRLLGPDEKFSFIKCDIEGSEVEFINSYGNLLEQVELLAIEIHKHTGLAASCAEQLVARGLVNRTVLRETTEFNVEMYARSGEGAGPCASSSGQTR